MCGIAGLWDVAASARARDVPADVAMMTATLAHRGPDGVGLWSDAGARVALGHRRLAIVDLTDAGSQPMASACGRYVLVTNGELYNHRELVRELARDGARFRGTSDTEVMVEAIAAWGFDRALARFVGMFALAVWDARARSLHLARDRFGEKPLYYGRVRGAFAFASELKALRALPGFDAELDLDALDAFFRYSYVPAPASIYRAARKLPAASTIAIRADSAEPAPQAYWTVRDAAERAARTPFEGSAEEAVDALDRALADSVRLRMQADVPVGAFLSGGLDSSTVTAMMAAAGRGRVRTFSVGMRDGARDEAPAARAVARHLGTEHAELYVGPDEARDIIPALPSMYDEPFADASAIPTLCVARLAARACKTVQAGDGSDELLGGYARYAIASGMWRNTRWLPSGARRTAGLLLERAPHERMRGIGRVLAGEYPQSIHWHLVTHWKPPGPLAEPYRAARGPGAAASGGVLDFPSEMRYLDLVTLLPDDLLVKVDRASMSAGLEVRLPFLDPAVVDLFLRLPAGLRARNGEPKWVLRRVLSRYLPDELLAPAKKGFSVPLGDWLRGPLRAWADELLSARRIREAGVLDHRAVRRVWADHCAGRGDRSRALWSALMFQAWSIAEGGRRPDADS